MSSVHEPLFLSSHTLSHMQNFHTQMHIFSVFSHYLNIINKSMEMLNFSFLSNFPSTIFGIFIFHILPSIPLPLLQ